MGRLPPRLLSGVSALLSVCYVAMLVLSMGCPSGEHDALLHDGHSRHSSADLDHLSMMHLDADVVAADEASTSAYHPQSDQVPPSDGVAAAGLCAWSCQANSTADVVHALVQSAPLLLADASVPFSFSSRSSVLRRTAPSRAPPVGV